MRKNGYNKSGKNGTYAIGIKKKGVLQHSLFCAGHLLFSLVQPLADLMANHTCYDRD